MARVKLSTLHLVALHEFHRSMGDELVDYDQKLHYVEDLLQGREMFLEVGILYAMVVMEKQLVRSLVLEKAPHENGDCASRETYYHDQNDKMEVGPLYS